MSPACKRYGEMLLAGSDMSLQFCGHQAVGGGLPVLDAYFPSQGGSFSWFPSFL